MATNHERVGKALDLLKAGLGPFVAREFDNAYAAEAHARAVALLGDGRSAPRAPIREWDAAALLKLMWNAWHDVFRTTLGRAERTLVSELREQRNRWAHQGQFSGDDAYRALDSAGRLLAAVSAPQGAEVEKMKTDLLRLRFDEQVRSRKRQAGGSLVEAAASGALAPWREVVTPHADVAGGRYRQAEFAADLWQVHLGEGPVEYRDPAEFFRRTYLTDSLTRLLVTGVRRLAGRGGDPVVNLQTNFGGGKTHSMLALYHLFAGVAPGALAGIDEVLRSAEIDALPAVRRVALVGNRISPGNPDVKPDGTRVRTLWGELAWQLGGAAAFARVRADDERATNPGDVLRELFNAYGPCLILVDEWVAYARALHDRSDLPAGSFETQFTFAQALTESAKLADACLLVISLPASGTPDTEAPRAEDVEVGGLRGREALDRLRNVVGRVESSWAPADAEESFEIVRRRLFEPLAALAFRQRDVTACAFADLYRGQHQEFPLECRAGGYEQRLRAAYPIHPEVFDRLYTDWSTLLQFQRTRDVLRLMAAVIHRLWEQGDTHPLILPSTIPIDDAAIKFELTRYLPDNWTPIIEKDVDGPDALPLALDNAVPNLGKVAACRRVARTIYLGSAPLTDVANRGLEDRRVKLGCVMPGESPAVFGDALRRLAGRATYLYQAGPRSWYATQPTVTKLAADRAAQFRRDPDGVARHVAARVRAALRQSGDFARVHALPGSSADVPDDRDAGLVVLDGSTPYRKEPGSPAETRAREILERRGSVPRLYRNALVFLAADATRLQDLQEAACADLAWESILTEAGQETLNLDPHQKRQAETQAGAATDALEARLPETYQWVLVPTQDDPRAEVRWQAVRLSGQDPLAVRAGKKLRKDDALITTLAASSLRMELDRVPLWHGDHVGIGQVCDDFARYPYLPRLTGPDVLRGAVGEGVALLSWEQDGFGYAESYDEGARRYRGLRGGQAVTVTGADSALLVRAEVARRQMDAEVPPARPDGGVAEEAGGGTWPAVPAREEPDVPRPGTPTYRRFHGSVRLDALRVGRDAGRVAEEVIQLLNKHVGADVEVTLEIRANLADGAAENTRRAVNENCRTLRFASFGFEEE